MNTLVVLPVKDKHKELFSSSAPDNNIFYYLEKDIPQELLPNVDIIIGNVKQETLEKATNIKWLQLNSAGADNYLEIAKKKGFILTNASGAYGLAISEHLLATSLCLIKKINLYYKNQLEHNWQDEGNVTSIYQARTLVVGLGDIGSEYAKRVKALGSYVVGIKRNMCAKPDYVDELYTMEALDTELPKADIVLLILPNTKETRYLINYQRLCTMKKTAILLNAGRGNAIITDDLVKALSENKIYGAALDVTDPEPLLENHPLWNAKNVIITPHVSGFYHLPETFERIVNIAAQNLSNFNKGKSLKNVVDLQTGYREWKNALPG